MVYFIMHLASIQDHERTKTLPIRGESYTKGEKNKSQREGRGVTLKNKHVKSQESMGVMCQVEKIQGTDKIKI
jgi:hypothetical protein